MTNISTWFRVALLSIVLVTCNVVPPSVGFARDSSLDIPSISPPTLFPERCPATKLLTILKEPQKTDFWCGVATAQIAMDYVFYRGTAPDQCDLVSPIASGEVMAGELPPDCCDFSQSFHHLCTKNRWPEEIFNYRGFSYSAPLVDLPYLQPQPPLPWSNVIDELCDEDRPYISTIIPGGGSKHSVIVHGYLWLRLENVPYFPPHFLLREVKVYDPLEDFSYWDWERFTPSAAPPYNTHIGDTYKIRKTRALYTPPRIPKYAPRHASPPF